MAKSKTIFVCSECGNESPKWLGKCPACNSWNTFYEQKVEKYTDTNKIEKKINNTPKPLSTYVGQEANRTSTGYAELDRVLGGGLVKGSLILLGGEPGIGKSTLILQLCEKVQGEGKVLYVSGEESAEQIKLRADRLDVKNNDLMFLGETDIDVVKEAISEMQPKLVIMDSIQTMYSDEITAAAGSVSQVREITAQIMRVCKAQQITTVIIGHVTKEGNIAGPRVLEHMVDTVLYFEGERNAGFRVLRAVKNRFGSTNEIGVFEMKGTGLAEVKNPSQLMLDGRPDDTSGSVVVCTMEGTRPILLEIQALVCQSSFNLPRRTSVGLDYNRVNLLLAVLEKRGGIVMAGCDAYVNIAGGMRLDDPSADLGIVFALVSSFKNRAIPSDMVMFGEMGLSGEVRGVSGAEQRVREAAKMGFKTCIIPRSNLDNVKKMKDLGDMKVVGVANIQQALEYI